jgi:rhodanese-related sulfurtransferase
MLRTLVLVGLCALAACAGEPPKTAGDAESVGTAAPTIFAPDALTAVREGRTFLIDVREDHELRSGIPDAPHIKITYFVDGAGDRVFAQQVLRAVDGKRDASITLLCEIGVRSERAREFLRLNGFSDVKSIVNGFQSWLDFDVPHKAGP